MNLKEQSKPAIKISISPEKNGIPREPTIQSCKHLNDIASSKRSTLSALSPVDSPFKKSNGMKSNTLKALLPFNSSSKNITGTLERSLRKLKPIQRDNPSTMSGD